MTENPEQASTNIKKETPSLTQTVRLWGAIGIFILAIILAGVIVVQIAEPLADLILGEDPEVPLPDGAVLIDEWDRDEQRQSAKHEWLYGTSMNGCDVARFYIDEGFDCALPASCSSILYDEESAEEFRRIGTCIKTEKDSISGYSISVDITDGYAGDLRARFRVYLYDN